MKAILLARVSTPDQEKGESIDAQRERMIDYTKRRGLEIFKVFEIVESSTKDTRKKFEEVLVFIRKINGPIALIIETIDRLQRSFKESVELDDLRKQGKIEIHFLRESLIMHQDSTSSDLIRWDMGVMFARAFVLQIGDNVKRSNIEKIRIKEYPGKCPIGYLNVTNPDGSTDIIPDPQKRHFIVRIFELYATGNYSLSMLADMMNGEGLKPSRRGDVVHRSQIENMLKNKFYYGVMKYKGQYSAHRYEPLITQELFERAQAVREGWGKKPFIAGALPFAFRGLILCKKCGSVVSPQIQKQRYIYYNCGNRKCPQHKHFIKEKQFIEIVESVFRAISLPETIISKLNVEIKKQVASESLYFEDMIMSLSEKLTGIQKKRARVFNKLLDLDNDPSSIAKQDCDKMYNALIQEEEKTAYEIQKHHKADQNFYSTILSVVELSKRAFEIYQSSKTEEKRALANYVFSNFILDDENIVYELREPFNILVKISDCPTWGERWGSNPQPSGPQPEALPIELRSP